MRERIKDEDVIWLAKVILANHKTDAHGKGMPLGNLTSQFLANVYLSKLDNFVKHELKAKYYLRYVDDFLILSRSKRTLWLYRKKIESFLSDELKLALHSDKTAIIPLRAGVPLLGFRVFCHHKLLKKSNQKRIWKRLAKFRKQFAEGRITKDKIRLSLAGWNGYAKMADTFGLRRKVMSEAAHILHLQTTVE